MKNLVFIILIISACAKQSDDFSKVPKIEILSNNSAFSMQQDILFFQKKPFSGFVVEKYQNGQIASKNGYLNGKLEGKQEKWFENGAKQEIRFYSANQKNGKNEGWHANGQQRFEYFIKNDVPIETHREWYPSGQLYSLRTYNNEGQPEGKQQMWFSTGQMKANYVIIKGRRFGFLGAKGCMGENEKKQAGLNAGKKIL